MSNLRKEVHLCPQVPTAAKVQALNASSKLASSWIMVALFPPNYSKTLPKRLYTVALTIEPTLLDPVNETSGMRGSLAMASPISAPP